MQQLKDCPFCGLEATLEKHYINMGDALNKNITMRFYCSCSSCRIETPHFEFAPTAVEFWNRRVKCMEC